MMPYQTYEGYINNQIDKSPKLQIKSYKLVAMHHCLGKLPFWNTKTFIIWRPAHASSFVFKQPHAPSSYTFYINLPESHTELFLADYEIKYSLACKIA